MIRRIGTIIFLQAIAFFCAISVHADDTVSADMLRLAHSDAAVRRAAIMALAKTGDPRLEGFLKSYRLGSIYIWKDRIVLCEKTIEDEDLNELAPLSDPLTRQPIITDGKQVVVPIEDLTEVSPSRRERRLADRARFLLRLSSPDPAARLSGAILGALTVNLLYNFFTSEKDFILFTWKAEYWQFIMGGLFIGVVLLFPKGLTHIWHRLTGRDIAGYSTTPEEQ